MPTEYEDELDRLFGTQPGVVKPIEQPVAAPEPVPAATAKIDKNSPYFDKCDRCRGSGSFYSYAGRYVGPCKRCNGTGGTMRATTNEERARAAELRAQRTASLQQARLGAFTAENPAEIAWINDRAPSFEFAAAMLEAVTKYGSLTEGQIGAVRKCMNKDAERNAERAAEAKKRADNAPVVSTDKLKAAFEAATASGLKKPQLRFESFTASLAKPTSKNPGCVYITGAGEAYFGKITPEGKFMAMRECPAAVLQGVVEAMKDPVALATAYGKRTGRCSCCGRELTDPVSVEAGIGPICASNFGF